jgi:hypothetical protein
MDIHALGCATFVGDEVGRGDGEDDRLVKRCEVLDGLLARETRPLSRVLRDADAMLSVCL